MTYITAVEAARRLGKSEKTIRRWVEEGRLAGFHPQGRKNRLAISEQDVEQLAKEQAELEPGPAEQDVTALTGRIDALEQRLARVEQLLASLTLPGSKAIETPSEHVAMPTAEQKPTRTRTASSSPAETPSDIPPGSILAYQFAQRYEVNTATLRDQIRHGHIPSTPRPKLNRPRENEYWLTPEQQRAALDYWMRNKTPHGKPLEQDSSEDQGKPDHQEGHSAASSELVE